MRSRRRRWRPDDHAPLRHLPRSPEFAANAAAMRGLVADLRQKVADIAQGGGAARAPPRRAAASCCRATGSPR